jgi:Na+:H+ antiporter, NhaA family
MTKGEPGSSRAPDEFHIRMPWARSDRLVPRTVLRPLQEFLDTAIAGSVLLLGAVVLALVWVNSPWRESYSRVWDTQVSLQLGNLVDLNEDLHFWVNDGLMALFFLVVGLEIKREVTSGELRHIRAAIVPVLAAVGGMAVPALVYLAVAGGGATGRGWGIPMATDIAFALGALTLAARYASPTLKPLLLTLAIADDIGAILVIAIFYTGGFEWGALAAAVAVVVLVVVAARNHVRAQVVYVALGVALWYLTYRAGINPTIAGVVLGLVTPAVPLQRPRAVSAEAHRIADETEDEPRPPDADDHWWMRLAWLSREAVSPMARTEHALLPWTSFVILPLFALANAGVELSARSIRDAATGAVGIGIFLGLVLGKPLGVAVGSFVATKTGLGRLPDAVGWGDLAGMGFTAGIGFTVALFIAELAFPDGPLLDQAKISILVASLVAGIVGYVVLRIAPSRAAVSPSTRS